MIDGMIRVAAISPKVSLANIKNNVDVISREFLEVAAKGASIAVFPELSLTGYTCADLFHNSTLLAQSILGIEQICQATEGVNCICIVGAPIAINNALYNCAIALYNGSPILIVPKTYIPNYNEFYEYRWFAIPTLEETTVDIGKYKDVPFSLNKIIEWNGVKLGIEICEDLWTPIPPSSELAIAGANVIVNLSASNDLIGKRNYLKTLISQQSARTISAYVYASAGWGESSTDLVFDGKCIIYENGTLLAESPRWNLDSIRVLADIDLMAIDRDRLHIRSFNQSSQNLCRRIEKIVIDSNQHNGNEDCLRKIAPHPFIPSGKDHLNERCDEIINIQAMGLARRLEATKCKTMVVGISGGLDSTLALLVACVAYDKLSIPRNNIIGVTMPGFGTTGRTYNNALKLMELLGVSIREISIVPAVNQHFKDIGQDPKVTDVTYENSQARERTQILMDIANKENGMVLGTGDLSELALGWATYNGDHMSMYGVNAGVPKTLVRHLVNYYAHTLANEETRTVLLDIVDTPISPELTPADEQGNIAQKTEDLVGPYELHDFYLYYMLRYGFSPTRIYQMARIAFEEKYTDEEIKKWLQNFFRRFFNQQFKRSCLPDGPKVGSVCLSPRGDWRMPSDAQSTAWLSEIETLA